MYHHLLRDASFWDFLFTVDQGLANDAKAGAVSRRKSWTVRIIPASHGGGEDLPQSYGCALEFLLRAGGLPQADDPAVGEVPRSQGVPGCRGGAGGRHAARAIAPARPGADRVVRRRPAHDRALRTLSWREHFPYTAFWKLARGRFVPSLAVADLPLALWKAFIQRGFSRGLAAITGVSFTDHDHGRPGDQGNFLKDSRPQKMLLEHPGGSDYIWSHSRFLPRVLDS